MELRNSAVGALPDQVLVLETAGTVENFVNAVSGIEGLQWLAESELSDLEPDSDFFNISGDGPMTGRLFLIMTDAGALTTLRLRFNEFQQNSDQDFPRGLAPLKHVFQQLRTMRFWGPEDRMAEFGLLDNWRFRLEHSQESDMLPFEAELWFRSTEGGRRQAQARFEDVVRSLGGEVSRRSVIPEISYHGMLGRIPALAVSELLEQGRSQFLLCEDVMLFRPVAQCGVLPAYELADADIIHQPASPPSDLGSPVLALLDGVPLVGHHLLDGRLSFDDPDGYETHYQANQRLHGTGMASLICHGELDAGEPPISRLLYVRPILRPSSGPGGQQTREEIPEEELPVDVVHRAVRRLFVGDGDEEAVAPEVRAINLSVCDLRRPFLREMSPMARLLDWLAVEYQVLFLVSAGNHDHDLMLDIPRESLSSLDEEDRGAVVLKALAADTRNRSLLSPAETLNGLTVGAAHADCSTIPDGYRLINPFVDTGFPNVVSAHGPGYRRSVKPDILLYGGRQSLSEKIGVPDDSVVLQVNTLRSAPGQRVAWPGEQGSLEATRYTRGTSNATALATRSAGRIYDLLHSMRSESHLLPPQDFDAVLMKALLVHAAHCEVPLDHYASILKSNGGSKRNKEVASRLLGYGVADTNRVMFCTDHRVTILGCSEIGVEEVHTYNFPSPTGLSGVPDERRMITTLAWLSPINCDHRNYRRAHLLFRIGRDLADKPLGVTYPRVRRGTVQHEVMEGRGARVINDGDQVSIRVECRADAGGLDERVRYALAVTLEVPEELDVLLYDEIQEKLSERARVPVNP